LYLRQEGRGIGLLNKLRAYDLQDEGYDTVEANRMLGHGADERDYSIGAHILQDLSISTIRLLTNNPEKVESLETNGISVEERVPLEPHLNRHNADYLQTKVKRMKHLLDLGSLDDGKGQNAHGSSIAALQNRAQEHHSHTGRPFVTLTYAQSLDGSLASADGRPLAISGAESLRFTHRLRATHDAILVGIGTVLADNPRLNVRRSEGDHPLPIVLDTQLRLPLDAQILSCEGPTPLVATNETAPDDRKVALENRGATVLRLSCDQDGICLDPLLDRLGERGVKSVMVEGGTEVLTSFLRQRHVNYLILTVAPTLIGGKPVLHSLQVGEEDDSFPRLENVQYRWLGDDLILEGEPSWPGRS
jgi:3,4-dihydroxy 2-butanone 4-phosphate synthase/GTP cyclohydrolase II